MIFLLKTALVPDIKQVLIRQELSLSKKKMSGIRALLQKLLSSDQIIEKTGVSA
jgi:hypothetical protein